MDTEAVAATIWVVEDDREMRRSLVGLLESAGHNNVVACATPGELLGCYDPEVPGCLLLDLHLPEMDGLQLLDTLRRRGSLHPFLIVSGHDDVALAVESMRQGAVDFVRKPCRHSLLLSRVEHALKVDLESRRRRRKDDAFRVLIDSLTAREGEVLEMVCQGMLTKQIARHLKISEKTVEVHRGNILRKLRVRSSVQLVRRVTKHSMSGSSALQSLSNGLQHSEPMATRLVFST